MGQRPEQAAQRCVKAVTSATVWSPKILPARSAGAPTALRPERQQLPAPRRAAEPAGRAAVTVTRRGACKQRLEGTPVFAGRPVPAKTLIEYLEAGHPLDQFLDDYQSVSREHASLCWSQRSECWPHALRSGDVRVLLDGNLPRAFAALLPGHRVENVHQRRWSDLDDRPLLDAAGLYHGRSEASIWTRPAAPPHPHTRPRGKPHESSGAAPVAQRVSERVVEAAKSSTR